MLYLLLFLINRFQSSYLLLLRIWNLRHILHFIHNMDKGFVIKLQFLFLHINSFVDKLIYKLFWHWIHFIIWFFIEPQWYLIQFTKKIFFSSVLFNILEKYSLLQYIHTILIYLGKKQYLHSGQNIYLISLFIFIS